MIIRSHECKQTGYEYTHDNKVLTIFSGKNQHYINKRKCF